MRLLSQLSPAPRTAGGLLCTAGLVLIVLPAPFAPALGVELLASGFWWWARATGEPARHVPRWSWLRRPATALWLAAAIEATLRGPAAGGWVPPATLGFWWRLEAVAVVWAALELLAALPLTRPYSDLPGPLDERGFWLPALLPVAGFLVLWRQASRWLDVGEVRDLAALLLLLTASLAAVRAFGRRRWTAGLRWLVVCDGGLAGALLASRTMLPADVALLWIGACGTHTYLLVAELEGATPRRGPVLATLWRATAATSSTALGWPLLAGAAGLTPGRAILVFLLGGLSIGLSSWVNVARMVEAPERRSLARPGSGLSLSRVAPAFLLSGVPVALVSAWWAGFAPRWPVALLALAPSVLGTGTALLTFRSPAGTGAPEAEAGAGPAADRWARAGRAARLAARRLFRGVTAIERALVAGVLRLLRTLAFPLRDLHTGDAQEYILFLVGVALLAALFPLLR
jgi:hypothetical protein